MNCDWLTIILSCDWLIILSCDWLQVRPGILVLVNDADWELLGQLDYQLEEGDNVVFISTLHGG